MSGPWEDFGKADGPWTEFAPAASKPDAPVRFMEEPSSMDKFLGMMPEWMTGNMRGSVVGGAMQGAADPGMALVQLGANAIGKGDAVNKRIQEQEAEYQSARAGAGRGGIDVARGVGSAAVTFPMGGAGAGVLRGAAVGAGASALDTVKDGGENFWTDKAKQAAIGAVGGAVMSPIMGALARVVSPKASVDEGVKLLRKEGVNPTVGQTLGGWANRLEEKATSLPIMGDMISRSRNRAVDQLNTAAINRAVAPIGGKVSGIGQDAVSEAGDQLSAAYRDALSKVGHVSMDTPTFNAKFGELQDMATGLTNGLDKKFQTTLQNVVLKRMSKNGSIVGDNLKKVDSELGEIASKWRGSSTASEREFGDAILHLKTILTDEVRSANPDVAKALKAADTGWANLVRVEGAASRGANNEGRFTPAQLMGAVKSADKSARKRAVGRGDALMQDLADSGSRLGNKVPDSGTVGRGLIAGGGLAAGLINPAIPVALAGGAALYTAPVQNALAAMIARRPEMAPVVANYLRQLSAPAAFGAGTMVQEFN
jgi:hypothetical protein